MKNTLLFACAWLAASLAAPSVLAQTAAPAAPRAKTTSAPAPVAARSAMQPAGDRVLTPTQLRDCLDQQTKVEGDAAGAERERTDIEAMKNDLKTSGTALDESLASLDRADPAAVEAYNGRVKEREERIAAYESRVSGYNGRVDGIRATRESFAKACGNRRYDVRDLEDLNRAKKK